MTRVVLVCTSLLVLVAFTSCAGQSSDGGELETRVAELETQLAQAETTPAASQGPSEPATAPPTPVPSDTPTSIPTATDTSVPIDTPTPEPPTPTPIPPTPTSPPPPSPTPTQPPAGTRANPVPRGQGRLAPDGWEVVVLDFNPDAWAVVLAENQFNDPPAPGNRMVMVRVGVTNVGAENEPAWISDGSFYFVGSYNVLYSTFGEESRCGVIPDNLAEELFRGGYAEGNMCFELPTDEANLRLLYEYAWNDHVFFAVQ